MSEETDFVDTMDTWLQARLESVHTTLPGKIQSYNPETRMATVVPGIRLRSLHGDVIDYKPIAGVPVVWPGCSKFSLIPATLEAGDGVMLHFSEGSIGEWLEGSDVHDPEDETRFSLHDCIAVPGLWQPSRIPGSQDIGPSDFGILGAGGEVLGGQGGKLDLRNKTSDLRTEIEKLWSAIITLQTTLQTDLTALAAVTTSAAALVPVVGGATPMTTALTGYAAGLGTLVSQDTTSKAAVGGLLA